MALVTVQRSPSPSTTPEVDVVDGASDESEEDVVLRSPLRRARSRSISESYLAVKGAAMILPQSECHRRITRGSQCGDITYHLQSMFYLIRPQDTIKIAVKLESIHSRNTRYLVVVSCCGRQDTEECTILGVDINVDTTIGLVFPIWADMDIRLDGDGGFAVSSQDRCLIFKPVSVQAMWSALQCLHRVSEISRAHYYFPGGLTHTWLCYYQSKIRSSQECVNEWEAMDDLMVLRASVIAVSCDTVSLENKIRTKLKEIMMMVDLEEVTTRYLRLEVEKALGMDLKEYKSFIDQETMTILGQLDKPSLVLDYLYLGSEWNASNLEELKRNEVGYILNVTREIDNFFPGIFEYMNIRVYDNLESDLLKYWEKTYKFIKHAQLSGSKCLVHCKMGISRSASTVIAYLMKEFNWSAEKAMNHTAAIRSCINPNETFRAQLQTYEGILDASNQRHNKLWKPSQFPRHISTIPDDDMDLADSQGTLKEIAEEILASKYGQPPPNPLILDDVELSSRSMDSMDECFPEIPTSVSSECDNIRLVYYRRLSDQIAEPLMTASIVVDKDQASSSSDSSELTVAFYNCLRAHQQGHYNRSFSPVPYSPDSYTEKFTHVNEKTRKSGQVENTTLDYESRTHRGRSSSGSSDNSVDDGKIEIKGEPSVNVPVIDIASGSDLLSETSTDDVRVERELNKMRRSPKLSQPGVFSGSPVPSTSKEDGNKPELSASPPHVSRRKKAKIQSLRTSESTDDSFEVFHIGDEEVVVKKGKVRRHTADFEQLKSEVDTVNKDTEDDIDESEIPPKGVVKVQKEAFESRGSACLPPVSPLSSSPKQREFLRISPPLDDQEVKETKNEECEFPSAGIVELCRRNYEVRDFDKSTKIPVKKAWESLLLADSPTACKLECSHEDFEESGQVPVRNLVHRFEQQSPIDECRSLAEETPVSASAPSSPSKLSRKAIQRPHSTQNPREDGAMADKPEQRKVRKSHGRTHPLERLSAPDPLTRNPFYKTM